MRAFYISGRHETWRLTEKTGKTDKTENQPRSCEQRDEQRPALAWLYQWKHSASRDIVYLRCVLLAKRNLLQHENGYVQISVLSSIYPTSHKFACSSYLNKLRSDSLEELHGTNRQILGSLIKFYNGFSIKCTKTLPGEIHVLQG